MTVGHKPVFCLSLCVNQSQKCRRSWRRSQLLDGLTRLVSEASEYYHYCSRIYIIFSRNDNCLWFSTHGPARRRFHPTSLFFSSKNRPASLFQPFKIAPKVICGEDGGQNRLSSHPFAIRTLFLSLLRFTIRRGFFVVPFHSDFPDREGETGYLPFLITP